MIVKKALGLTGRLAQGEDAGIPVGIIVEIGEADRTSPLPHRLHQVRDTTEPMGSHDNVQMRGLFQQADALLLGHASAHADDEIRVFSLDGSEAPQKSCTLFVRPFPECCMC